MHQLDVFLRTLKTDFDKGTRARNTKEYEHRRYLMKRATSQVVWRAPLSRHTTWRPPQGAARRAISSLKSIYKENNNHPIMDFEDPKYKRLKYVRYADD